MVKLPPNNYVSSIFRLEFEDGNVLTFDRMHRLVLYDQMELIDHFIDLLTVKDDYYLDIIVRNIIIEFWIKENHTDKPLELLSTLKRIKKIKNPNRIISANDKKLLQYKIPSNRNYLEWGEIILNHKFLPLVVKDIKDKNNKTYYIRKQKNCFEIDLYINEKLILNFKDYDLNFYSK